MASYRAFPLASDSKNYTIYLEKRYRIEGFEKLERIDAMSNSEDKEVQWKSPAGTYWRVPCKNVESWADLRGIQKWFRKQADFTDQEGRRPNKFIYRGQGPHGDLKTSIERAFEEFEIDSKDRPNCEKQLIRSFQRKAPYHLKGVSVPAIDNTLEWLSLMQHFGAPTRLLDWSYSFYRALYNAVSKDSHKDKLWGKYESELWVMNTIWFTEKTEGNPQKKITGKLRGSIEKLKKKRDKTELLDALKKAKEEVRDYKGNLENNRNKLVQYLMDLRKPISLVYNVTPIGLNERMIYQQGTFVLPGDVTKCFMQNLESYKKDNCKNHLYRIVIKLDQQERNKIIEELNDMNINEAVLFPGLDGFARSLRMKLAFLHKR